MTRSLCKEGGEGLPLCSRGCWQRDGHVGLGVVEHVVWGQGTARAVCTLRVVSLHLLLLVVLALEVLMLLLKQDLAWMLHHVRLLRVRVQRQALRMQRVLPMRGHTQRQVTHVLQLVLVLQVLVHLVLLLLLVVILLQVVLDLLLVLQLLLLLVLLLLNLLLPLDVRSVLLLLQVQVVSVRSLRLLHALLLGVLLRQVRCQRGRYVRAGRQVQQVRAHWHHWHHRHHRHHRGYLRMCGGLCRIAA